MISIYFDPDSNTYVCVTSNHYAGTWMMDIPSAIESFHRYAGYNTTHSCFDPHHSYTLIAQAPTIDDFYLNYPELFL